MSLKGDLKSNDLKEVKSYVSCLICSARGFEVLKDLLSDLSQQTLNKECFEVVVLYNGSVNIQEQVEEFSKSFSLAYFYEIPGRLMLGALRNKTIEFSRGEYLLFLDDDTRIVRKDFLEKSLEVFERSKADIICPQGKAIPAVNDRYNYLDPYSYAARCCFYKRSFLERVGGFYNELAAYEDIDLGIRSHVFGGKILKTRQLEYMHPKLFFKSMQKPIAIGQSIFKLQKHYPWYLWTLVYVNALRFLPLGLVPTARNQQWFKISWGVLIAPFISKEHTYRY